MPGPRQLAAVSLLLLGALPWPAAATAGGPAATGWVWPLDPRPAVLAHFDAPVGPFAAGHRGVDLAARAGQPVRAAGPGTVAYAGTVAGKPVVSIDHAGGLRTTYEPVVSVVRAGDRVAAGTTVGLVAVLPGHCLPATCLHWGLRSGPGLDAYRDPLPLLGAPEVRLLPVWGTGTPLGAEPRSAVVPAGRDRGPLMAGGR